MSRFRATFLALFVTALLGLAAPVPPASAQTAPTTTATAPTTTAAIDASTAQSDVAPPDQGPSNQAVAVNTHNGSSVFSLAFSIRQLSDSVVAPSNTAVAYASCTQCQTVAIAVQIIFVSGSPSTFTPTNVALAMNVSCNLCDTLATAYQFVVQSSGPVRLTADGHRQIEQIRHQLEELRSVREPTVEEQAQVQNLMNQLWSVLQTQVVLRHARDDQHPPEGDATTSTSSTAVPNGATSTTTSTAPASGVQRSPATTSTTAASGGSTPTTTASPSTTTSTTPTTSPTPTPTTAPA